MTPRTKAGDECRSVTHVAENTNPSSGITANGTSYLAVAHASVDT